ncbi:MAG: SphA family protein [Wenzhouxiangella sp.]
MLLALGGLSPAHAQVVLPPINLGNTNFMDGRALPGTMFQQTLIAADADRFSDNNGATQPAPDGLRTVGIATQVAWLSDHKLLGANWGAEFILPLVHVDLDVVPGLDDRQSGFGDLFLSPLVLQWPEKRLLGKPFWQRLNLNFTVPLGRYDRNRLANTGTNTYRANPHYAATWMFSQRWEISARFHYLWNGRNNDPSPALGADWTQAGEAVHTNLAISREIAPGLRLGLAGYHLRQISDDRIDGRQVRDSREQVVGFGPGIRFQRGPQVLFVHAYHETAVRNRPERNQVIVRYARFF